MNQPPDSIWLTAKLVARVSDITERAARKAIARGIIDNSRLSVRRVNGRGGPKGLKNEVLLDSLPADLQARYWADNPRLPVAATAHHKSTLATRRAAPDWERRLAVIRPVLAHPRGSPEYTEAIRAAAEHSPYGDRTIYRWIEQYQAKRIAGLRRKARADKGGRLVIVSRQWDKEVPFDEAKKREIAAALLEKIKDLWGANAAGWKHVATFATTELIDLTRAAGLNLSDDDLLKFCAVPRHLAERGRRMKIVATRDNDAKAFSDLHTPRVRRSRRDLKPMQLVAGDVHHGDNLIARPDGSTCTPKYITWHDLATNRVFMTILFPEKGEGIRQEHVIASFIAMTQDPLWGMPGGLVLDNGSEYNWTGFVEDALRLTNLTIADLSAEPDLRAEFMAARRGMTIKNRPYQPQGKVTETIFAVLEGGAFRMLPAHIGGNRMAKKTQNVGREMPAFADGDEAWRAQVRVALDYYETLPQTGHLNGKSPREAFNDAFARGWKRTDIDPDALHAVFARDAIRTIKQGAFTYNNQVYRDKALLTLTGQRVRVRIPLVGGCDRLAVMDDADKLICMAEASPVYGFLDPEGARDQAEWAKEQRRQLADMRAERAPVDLTDEMRRAAALHPPAPVPESAGTIRLLDEHEAVGKARKALGPKARRDAQQKRDDEIEARYAEIESAARVVSGARR